MTHILMRNYGGSKLMIDGVVFNGDPAPDAIVGEGKGAVTKDEGALVDCQNCIDRFPIFHGGQSLSDFLAS